MKTYRHWSLTPHVCWYFHVGKYPQSTPLEARALCCNYASLLLRYERDITHDTPQRPALWGSDSNGTILVAKGSYPSDWGVASRHTLRPQGA